VYTLKGAYVFAVLRLGEVSELSAVHVLVFKQLTVLLLAQVVWVDAISPQELLVGHTEGLPNGLGYELGLVMKAQLAPSSLSTICTITLVSEVFGPMTTQHNPET